MKCLIAMAVYDTEENKRTKYTKETVRSLIETTCSKTTRIIIIDNNSCQETKEFLLEIKASNISVITNDKNIGTAEAINLAWKTREKGKGEYAVKIDNDVVIHDDKWIEKMIYCFEKEPYLGILGLKRKDLPNKPDSEEYPTSLCFIKHEHEKMDEWHVIEICNDIIGTCLMFSPKLLDKIGYLYQPKIYGFDDNLACVRSIEAGFVNAFYPCIEIDHIDDGSTPFTQWKKNQAQIYFQEFEEIKSAILNGENPMMPGHKNSYYYNPFEK
jgi:GT2 family glycosyltransferase